MKFKYIKDYRINENESNLRAEIDRLCNFIRKQNIKINITTESGEIKVYLNDEKNIWCNS